MLYSIKVKGARRIHPFCMSYTCQLMVYTIASLLFQLRLVSSAVRENALYIPSPKARLLRNDTDEAKGLVYIVALCCLYGDIDESMDVRKMLVPMRFKLGIRVKLKLHESNLDGQLEPFHLIVPIIFHPMLFKQY